MSAYSSVPQIVLGLGVECLGVAAQVQPLALSLGAQHPGVQHLGAATSKSASLRDRCRPGIEA